MEDNSETWRFLKYVSTLKQDVRTASEALQNHNKNEQYPTPTQHTYQTL